MAPRVKRSPGDRKTIRISKLPRDVTRSEIDDAFAGCGRIVAVDILETKNNRTASHAMVNVEWNRAEGKGPVRRLRQNLSEGIIRGRTDVVVNVLPSYVAGGGTARGEEGGGENNNGVPKWELAKVLAADFHAYVNSDPAVMARAGDREDLGKIFAAWIGARNLPPGGPGTAHLCSLVMAALRRKKLMRSSRAGEVVVITFAGTGGPGDFPPAVERKEARERVLKRRERLGEDKEGVTVSEPSLEEGVIVLPGHALDIAFDVSSKTPVTLRSISIGGSSPRSFTGSIDREQNLSGHRAYSFLITFRSTGTGIYRATVSFHFRRGRKRFVIARYVTARSGDTLMQDALKPKSPYKKKILRPEPKIGSPVTPAPSDPGRKSILYENLPLHRIPLDVKERIVNKELDPILVKPEDNFDKYSEFWKYMLWASELQAKIDITLYDLEQVSLMREGNLYILSVPGLAEGRPSVLKGDIVIVTCRNKRFQGRVQFIRLLEVVLDFDPSFRRFYVSNVDRVDVRFTFSRTTFRTSHEGCHDAPNTMGQRMLLPEPAHKPDCAPRIVRNIRWANRNLNHEQKVAVENILCGRARPLPYIIFGPPGTGKTTTVVEVIYQLAQLSSDQKILLIAPSNDAADILAARLSPYFSPAELRRTLAYSRSIDQVAVDVRPYCREGLPDTERLRDVMKARIVVGTVNLSARLSFLGVPRGHFDVLCVDEAGHATEPEAVSVAATLMDFQRSDESEGQIILAGDPRQLGPIITSEICKKYGMDISYMERLTTMGMYGRSSSEIPYPPDLLTKLIRNYRSHPSIMELPNELFYDNELQMCGDRLSTHSLAKWEHLPNKGHPILFHAVHGENLREGNSPSWFNPQEAQQVADYVELLVRQTRPAVAADDIGIITPYARQAQKIRIALKIRDLGEIKVGSVETFQGQERRVIILSTVRAENDLLAHDIKYNLGFVASEKRFNVAITRAKSLLIIIGHPKVLATDKKCWLPLMRLCKEKENWLGQDWDEDDSSSDEDGGDADSDSDDDSETGAGVSQAVEQEGAGYINREE